MPEVVTDDEIARLIAVPKKLEGNPLKSLLTLRRGRHVDQRSMEFFSASGDKLRIIVRQNRLDPLDFSVILGYQLPSGRLFRLRRYNGRHEHRNTLENEQFYGFHIHAASERYQKAGRDEESHAKATVRFKDVKGALECLLEDCAFEGYERNQMNLFEE